MCGFPAGSEGRGAHLTIPGRVGAVTVARWLRGHLAWLATKPEGPEEFAFLKAAHDNLVRLFDRPPDQLYLGSCDTEHDDAEQHLQQALALADACAAPFERARVSVVMYWHKRRSDGFYRPMDVPNAIYALKPLYEQDLRVHRNIYRGGL